MPDNVWYEITYPFLNFNGCIVEVYEWISNFILHIYETRYTNDITRYVPTVTRNLSRNALRELGNAVH